jgi:hypothetical protein
MPAALQTTRLEGVTQVIAAAVPATEPSIDPLISGHIEIQR